MHRNVEENVLPVCEELGIGFVPYSPLNRGFLGGMINEYTRFEAANDNRQTLPRFQPDAIRANMRIVEVLNVFGRTRGITPAQVALAWLMNKKPVYRTDSRNDKTFPFGRKSAGGRNSFHGERNERIGGGCCCHSGYRQSL